MARPPVVGSLLNRWVLGTLLAFLLALGCLCFARGLTAVGPARGDSNDALIHNISVFERAREHGFLSPQAKEICSGQLLSMMDASTANKWEVFPRHTVFPPARFLLRVLDPDESRFRKRISTSVVDRGTTLVQVARLGGAANPLQGQSQVEPVVFAIVHVRHAEPPIIPGLNSESWYLCLFEPPLWRVLFIYDERPNGIPEYILFLSPSLRQEIIERGLF